MRIASFFATARIELVTTEIWEHKPRRNTEGMLSQAATSYKPAPVHLHLPSASIT